MIIALPYREIQGLYHGLRLPFDLRHIAEALVFLAPLHPDEGGEVQRILNGIGEDAFEGASLSRTEFAQYLLQGSLMLYELLQHYGIAPPYHHDIDFVDANLDVLFVWVYPNITQ